MAENSKIEWTTHTFNPWMGCTKVHAGCTNCYAEELMDNRYGKVAWGPNGTRVKTADSNWRKPLQWNRAAWKAGERHRVFCASLSDVFEDWRGPIVDSKGLAIYQCDSCVNVDGSPFRHAVPLEDAIQMHGCGESMRLATMDDLRADLFRLIDTTPHIDWLLLTKRPEAVCWMWPEASGDVLASNIERDQREGWCANYRPNVWIGTSVSDQATADKAIPELLTCRYLTPCLFLSVEPLVGPVDLTPYLGGRSYRCQCGFHATETELIFSGGDNYRCAECGQRCEIGATADWTIVGGESGHGARPCDVEWVRSIVAQCKASDVPCFVKQLGLQAFDSECEDIGQFDGSCGHSLGSQDNLHYLRFTDKKGGDIDEFPDALRVRQFPQIVASP